MTKAVEEMTEEELTRLLDEKRAERWRIIFAILITDTAEQSAKEAGLDYQPNMKIKVKLKAFQADLIRQYDEDIAVLEGEFTDRGEEIPRRALDWRKSYRFPVKSTPMADCLALAELSDKLTVSQAAAAHLVVFLGVKVKFYGQAFQGLYDPCDFAALKKVQAGDLTSLGIRKRAWLKLVPVSQKQLDHWLAQYHPEGRQDELLPWDEALTAKQNLTGNE